mmetsp:Transcript_16437/g.40655  ORF Transcript_16437/g.40655 Transcript_16437/m.40655 type:complete len:436 (-) Transcript_16437:151-1458(-)
MVAGNPSPAPHLQTILDMVGPRDEVLSFLHAEEVATFACVSSGCRAAATKENGKLRAVNLLVNFETTSSQTDTPEFVPAKPARLGYVYAMVDVPLLESLMVRVNCYDAEGQKSLGVELSEVLGQLLSLMGEGLRTFYLSVELCSSDGDDRWTANFADVAASQSAINHFAQSLLGLTQLRTLFLPAGLGERAIALRPCQRTKMASLERLHLFATLCLRNVSSASLLVVLLGASGEGGDAATRITQFSCHGFDADSFSVLKQPDHAGAKLWRSVLTPELRKLGFCRWNWHPYANSLVWAEGMRKEIFAHCQGVTHCELDCLPPRGFAELFPSLKSLYLNKPDYDNENRLHLRQNFLHLIKTVLERKIVLHLREAEFSGAECGCLLSMSSGGTEYEAALAPMRKEVSEALTKTLSDTVLLMKDGPELFPYIFIFDSDS